MPINEETWISFLKRTVPKGKGVIVSIGDDCALVTMGKERVLVASDLSTEGVHFPPLRGKRRVSFKTIGMRSVGRVLSDFAACGSKPSFVGVSVGVPRHVSQRNVKALLEGVLVSGREYGFSLVGGDTGRAKELVIDVWALGPGKGAILRSTARVGDFIFVSGPLGKTPFIKPFIPRLALAQKLQRYQVNAMIDISDGFLLDLGRLLSASKKGALLEYEKIPLTAGDFDMKRGEDYELIFTVDKHEKRLAFLQRHFFCVGRVQSVRDGYQMKKNGVSKPVRVCGYRHW